MGIIPIKYESSGNEYKVCNGTHYHIDTPSAVIWALEDARKHDTRLTLDYGDIKTGKSWGEQYDMHGKIGRSTGEEKIPLLIHNSRSMGGGSILSHCIVSIKTSKGKHPLYTHKTYKPYES